MKKEECEVNGQYNESTFGLVSIIMPNYNSESYIAQAINSVISQSYKNWELIFVDDCSTDASLQIAKSFEDPRIKIYINQNNSGAATTRNVGIEKAKGDWVAFLDSDDIWEQNKIEEHLRFMIEQKSDFSCTAYSVYKDGKILTEYNPKKQEYGYKDIVKHNCIGCSTVIYNAKSIGKYYMPVQAIKREDLACWLEILKSGIKVKMFHKSLTKYTLRSKSVSSKKFEMLKYQWQVYRKVEKINFFRSVYYLICWAFKGLAKYR